MSDITTVDGKLREAILKDPLNELTRNKRKYLLLTSAIAIAVKKGGFIPTKIETLGITLEQTEQDFFLIFTSLIAMYFMLSFLVYALTDFLAWLNKVRELQKGSIPHEIKRDERLKEKGKINYFESPNKTIAEPYPTKAELRQEEFDRTKVSKLFLNSITPIAYLKSFIDYILPFVIGIYVFIINLAKYLC